VILLIETENHLASGAQVSLFPAQRGPDEAAERPVKGGPYRKRWKRRVAPRRRRGSAFPLLDNMVGSACTEYQTKASRKKRRAYHRLRTGLEFHFGKILRFITLTLVAGSLNDIHKCFRVIKERIRRLTPNKLRQQDTEGYFTDAIMRRLFGDKDRWDKPLKFEYFSVIISGERPHMHILYVGDWLPHAWLKKVWLEITGDSDIVDIRIVKQGIYNSKRLAGYVLNQYILNQDGDIRFQMSQGWTWRGMVRDWKHAVKTKTRKERGLYKVDFKGLLDDWVKVIKSKKTKQMVLE
jgi:hypothetical protein